MSIQSQLDNARSMYDTWTRKKAHDSIKPIANRVLDRMQEEIKQLERELWRQAGKKQ